MFQLGPIEGGQSVSVGPFIYVVGACKFASFCSPDWSSSGAS